MLRDDGGFTLVELLISIVILGIIMTALVGAIVVGLKTTSATQDELTVSHDAQIASAYFAKDVQSSVTVTVAGATSLCGSSTGLVVSFGWPETSAAGAITYVTATYTLSPPSGGQGLLTRSLCRGGASPVTNTVAHFVQANTSPAGYTLVCPTLSNPSQSCTSPSGNAREVSLTLNTCYLNPTSSVCMTGTNYSFTVSGTRRSS